jgi:hypothetical protein
MVIRTLVIYRYISYVKIGSPISWALNILVNVSRMASTGVGEINRKKPEMVKKLKFD